LTKSVKTSNPEYRTFPNSYPSSNNYIREEEIQAVSVLLVP